MEVGVARRLRTRIAWAVLVLLAIVAAVEAVHLNRLQHWNALIDGGRLPSTVDGLPPEIRFAAAHALAASGVHDQALDRYRSLQSAASSDDTPLGRAARFNAANLLLRQAITVRAGDQPGQAITLIELAKESYREVLRHEPEHWGARYNLERAQRLLPDPGEVDDAPSEAKRDAERAATTMRGYSPGLP